MIDSIAHGFAYVMLFMAGIFAADGEFDTSIWAAILLGIAATLLHFF